MIDDEVHKEIVRLISNFCLHLSEGEQKFLISLPAEFGEFFPAVVIQAKIRIIKGMSSEEAIRCAFEGLKNRICQEGDSCRLDCFLITATQEQNSKIYKMLEEAILS